MKKLAILLMAVFTTACAHTQVPPASVHSVTLTWTAPASSSTWSGCTTTAPCVYAIYRCVGTASTCPSVPTSSTSWTEITTATTRPSATTYVDLNVTAAATYTYVVETVQASVNSGPSNTTTATIPNTGIPTAPALGSPTTATGAVPQMPGNGVPSQTLVAVTTIPMQVERIHAPMNLKVVR